VGGVKGYETAAAERTFTPQAKNIYRSSHTPINPQTFNDPSYQWSAFCVETVLADIHAIDVLLETALAYSRMFAMKFPDLFALRVNRLQLHYTV
jgi:hypothetical protein